MTCYLHLHLRLRAVPRAASRRSPLPCLMRFFLRFMVSEPWNCRWYRAYSMIWSFSYCHECDCDLWLWCDEDDLFTVSIWILFFHASLPKSKSNTALVRRMLVKGELGRTQCEIRRVAIDTMLSFILCHRRDRVGHITLQSKSCKTGPLAILRNSNSPIVRPPTRNVTTCTNFPRLFRPSRWPPKNPALHHYHP